MVLVLVYLIDTVTVMLDSGQFFVLQWEEQFVETFQSLYIFFFYNIVFLVEDPFLVVVRDSIIYGISLNPDDKSNDAMVPVAGLQNGYDVDFDDNEQTIYWVEHPVRVI